MVNRMDNREFQEELEGKITEIEAVLAQYLPRETGYQETVIKAMNYSMLAGGKRLRPMLMLETYHMFGGRGKEIYPFMAAIEMIHTYSLVHDDLPAMDNDEYRRGRATTWVTYGEGMGVLAGDALLNYAFETAMKAFGTYGESTASAERLQAIATALRVLAHKAGIYGMIGGQTADIEAESMESPLSKEQLLFIHKHKTAALMEAAMMVGAILAGAGQAQVEAIEKCASDIGIAFQIQDDILDIIGDSEELGKAVGSDALNNKQTYVTLNGLEQSKEDVEALSKEAVDLLRGCEGEHAFLEQLILTLIHRRK